MFKAEDGLRLSATDVANHLGCTHRTTLDRLDADGELKKPFRNDAGINALRERGIAHERAYLDALRTRGHEVLDLSSVKGRARYAETRAAMERGVDIIAQGALQDGRWMGYPDVLRRVSEPSQLGRWSYEALDTKLAQETKAGAVLQLCLYSELLASLQGRWPTHLTIVPPSDHFAESVYRTDSFAAYFRWVRRRLEESVEQPHDTYPEPVPLCDVCDWWSDCDQRRRADDHLSLVAGITRLQRGELESRDIRTLTRLASLALPIPFRPTRSSAESLTRVREQARVQLVSRPLPVPVHELLLDHPQQFGLERLPEPRDEDLFLDLEGSPFALPGGQEYLFGLSGPAGYRAWWASSESEEKSAFELVIRAIVGARRTNPGVHVFHYNHYEVTAFKRLACKYSTCESELDQLLRGEAFVDLYPIVKNSVRAGVESYSIKSLEPLYGFNRKADLRLSSERRHALEASLELGRFSDVSAEDRALVQTYNEDDCESARELRRWLEERRHEFRQAKRVDLSRPRTPEVTPDRDTEPEELKRRRSALKEGVPENARDRTEPQQARWLLSELLSWFWRERKARAWERYRLLGVAPDELPDEPRAVSGLSLVKPRVGGTALCPVDRYDFPAQDLQIEPGDELFVADAEAAWGRKIGTVEAISVSEGTLEVKKTKLAAKQHPEFVLAWRDVPDEPLPSALERLADSVIDSGMEGRGPLDAARQLILAGRPRFDGGFELHPSHSGAGDAVAAALALDESVLPIQGPPGSGKTTTAARMICALVNAGKRVGVTASSHKAVQLLLEKAVEEAEKSGRRLRCVRKCPELDAEPARDVGEHGIVEVSANGAVDEALDDNVVDVVGGTPWLWAREEMRERVDVLFIDEAGQMWLASALAAAQGGKSVVLLGDPQQLDQVQQGSHPEGVAVSVLRHVMGKDPGMGEPRKTLPPDRGLFLTSTHRLAPAIARFTSEIFYDGLLASSSEASGRALVGSTFAGTGLWFVPVEHDGDKNSSPAEAKVVADLVSELLASGTKFSDARDGTRALRPEDILVVAPYNAHVREIAHQLRGTDVRVGTVDKFQGQQAPVVIYSMATSRPEDAPRGMEFLYSLNRLNVATSRAQCVSILVANRALFEPNCQSPTQMQLANAFCRYRELAEESERHVLTRMASPATPTNSLR